MKSAMKVCLRWRDAEVVPMVRQQVLIKYNTVIHLFLWEEIVTYAPEGTTKPTDQQQSQEAYRL